MRNNPDLAANEKDTAIEITDIDQQTVQLHVGPNNISEKHRNRSVVEVDGADTADWRIRIDEKKLALLHKEDHVTSFSTPEKGFPEWGRQKSGPQSDHWISMKHLVDKDARIYGLGEKTRYLEKSNGNYEMWNRDTNGFYTHNEDPLYMSIPFYIVAPPTNQPTANNQYLGIFVDQPELSQFDVKHRAGRDKIGLAVASQTLDLFVIQGSGIRQIIQRYTDLTGKPFFPPKWALGYHHSKYGAPKNQQEALELASQFRNREIPCDALYFDIQHMEAYKVFTWHSESFSDPEKMIQQLHDRNFKTVTIVDPGVKLEPGYSVYDSGSNEDVYVKNKEGDNFAGSVWPGLCVFPDFVQTRVRDWWAAQNKRLLDIGIDGIWNDMNEPAIFFGENELQQLVHQIKTKVDQGKPLDYSVKRRLIDMGAEASNGLIHSTDSGQKVSHLHVHNTYGLYEAQATKKAFRDVKPQERNFILTRAGFSGIQNYAATWTGDNSSTWEHLRLSIFMTINLGLSGIPFSGPDVGGFDGDVEPELLTRWIQLGSVLPFFRNHSSIDTIPQEPWSFGEPYESINRRFIQFRYELLPYLYTLFYQAHKTGIPIIRPLFMEFPNDQQASTIQTEFMLGSSLLVAPAVEREANKVHLYLPPTRTGNEQYWQDWWTGETLLSGHHIVDAPLDHLPLYLREDHGVPTMNTVLNTEQTPSTLYLRCNLTNKVEVPIYDDDGHSFDYQQGNYFKGNYEITKTKDEMKINLTTNHQGFDPFWNEVKLLPAGYDVNN